MVKTQVAWQAKWVSLFLGFSCESLRTLWQHAAEYLSHSVYHNWNVSWCFKWLGHLSCMVRWRNVRLHREERRGGDERGIKRVKRHRCVCVCVHVWVCAIMYINHIVLISMSGNFHLPYVTIIHSDFHLFYHSSPPPQQPFYPFIYRVIIGWLVDGDQIFGK